jgi:hypothetical protein
MEDMKSFLYQTYSMILERLRYAEAKNTIVVTLLGVLVIGAFRIYDETPSRPLIATAYFWIFLVFAIMAICIALSSFMPNLKLQYLYKTKDPLSTDSLIYYEHISKFNDAKSYVDAVNRTYFSGEAVSGNLEYDLGAQIILNSRSVYRKSLLSYYAIVFSMCAILTPFIGGLFLILNHYFYWSSDGGRTKLKFGRKKDVKEEIKEIRNHPYDFIKFFKPILPRKRFRKISTDDSGSINDFEIRNNGASNEQEAEVSSKFEK